MGGTVFVRKELARDLISSGVHFGHGVSRWNPKMKPYIFGKRGMIHIINVKETLKGLLIAKKLLSNVVSSGKDVVFVGTKRQGQKAVMEVAEKCGMHYISERWLGGMLTNFRTIRSRLQRLEELEGMEASGKLEAESKKQGSRLKREMRKISTNLSGVRKMNRLPGAVVVVDAKKEIIALREAAKLGIPTIGIIDTDSDPDTVDIAIPANDDSIKAIEILLGELAEAVAVGKTMFKPSADTAKPARRRSKRPTLASAAKDAKKETAGAPETPVTEPEVAAGVAVTVEVAANPEPAAKKAEAPAEKQ
jgi:small subunit ribosomal protein S2